MDANAAYLFAMTIATLAFGAAAAQQDVREGKIGNRLVFSGIAFAALANVAVAFYDARAKGRRRRRRDPFPRRHRQRGGRRVDSPGSEGQRSAAHAGSGLASCES